MQHDFVPTKSKKDENKENKNYGAEKEELFGFDIKRLKSPNPVLTFLDRFLPVTLEFKFLAPVHFYVSKCLKCDLCLKNCDTKSITKGLDGVKTINQKTCKRCYTCARECPGGAVTVNWTRNEKILRLAKKIVKSPGSRIMV